MRHPSWLAASLATGLFLTACETDDIGKACGTEPAGIGGEPIAGEEPEVEVVRMQRDGACETFQCLEHMGIAPYCTRACATLEKSNPKTCTTDTDCVRPEYCEAGFCQDDDCPAGFRCGTVQDVGPLAGQRFCLRSTGCIDDLACDAPGRIECRFLSCFDVCNLRPEECTFHQRVCEPSVDLEGVCQQVLPDQQVCGTSPINCQLSPEQAPWCKTDVSVCIEKPAG